MQNKTKTAFLLLLSTAVAILFLIPLLWMISNSFKTDLEAILPNVHFIPEQPTLDNYATILQSDDPDISILRWMFNSLFAGIAGTAIVVVIDSLAAYGLARLDVPFRKTLFTLFVSTLMIPGVLTFLPQYLEFNYLH